MLTQYPHPLVAKREIIVAFGGNTTYEGVQPADTISNSINALVSSDFSLSCKSTLYKTPCFPPGSGPDFVNAIAVYVTSKSPDTCLTRLHQVEKAFGRKREGRWGARSLDLDLLAHGDAICPDRDGYQHWADLSPERQRAEAPGELILPHPRIQDRAFVLVPLAEIRPDWRHPVTGLTPAQMLKRLGPAASADIVALPEN